MVKSINFLDKLIFNYLEKERSAILLSQTGFFMDCELNDGVLWAQFNDENQITAVISGDNEKCVAFASENADFEELSFVINGSVLSSDKLPYKQIDKKYLMHISLENIIGEKGIKYTQYNKIEKLNDKLTPEHTDVKKFLNLKGCCEGAVIEKGLHTVSGGFISFNKDLAFISDIFTKEKYRGQGYGKAIVKKLLAISPRKDVYLISRDYNVKFYEKLGFTIAQEIYEYTTKEN
ncbi:MAG: GNAT family N-acetyltransferase [Clostridia bacterium]|nr:GNAT family N-acetyltransferase [Clostridia bacterium]